MCGLTGFFSVKHASAAVILKAMANALYHRGPDDSGYWFDSEVGLGMAHRRLSILDLSPAGHQPMMSPSGRYVIVFNGEIYNHLELRKELENIGSGNFCNWCGHSDTETLLAGFDAWGIEETLRRTIGMFAIALWDREERCLSLMRDRVGEKPLYYGWVGDVFLFASELKALRAYPSWQGSIDRNALSLFLRHNYIPAPYSIYEGIRKLIPGTVLTICTKKVSLGIVPSPVPYWTFSNVAKQGITNPFKGSDIEAVAELDRILSDSVKQQMIADVPLGAFLSGGVDSSTIVALMQKQSRLPVKTYTIGFAEKSYNEAGYAKAVARHLNTDHTELYVTAKDAIDVIPSLPDLYDEPFSDSSQIPTFLVSKLTRQHVTVSLSGDAGDELFGGYNRYFLGRSIWGKIGWIPKSLRRALAASFLAISPARWDMLISILPEGFRLLNAGDRMHKLAEIFAVESAQTMYRQLISHWKKPCEVVIGSHEPVTIVTDSSLWPEFADFTQWMMYLDTLSYLPDDILVKVDRAAMAVSLETRVPFLDHRVIEFASSLPLSFKIRNGQGKWLLRQVLYKHVPKELIERPKMGFGVPIDSWLRGPLREWAESLLSEARLQREGFFHSEPIRRKWLEHLSGSRNWQYYLWDVLMFQAWLENII